MFSCYPVMLVFTYAGLHVGLAPVGPNPNVVCINGSKTLVLQQLVQYPNVEPIGPKLGMAPMSTSGQLGLAKAFMAVSNFDQKP